MYPPSNAPQLPRYVDAQRYAQWAVRRIGIALALGILAPFVLYVVGGLTYANTNSDPILWIFILTGAACPLVAIASLCFARAPH